MDQIGKTSNYKPSSSPLEVRNLPYSSRLKAHVRLFCIHTRLKARVYTGKYKGHVRYSAVNYSKPLIKTSMYSRMLPSNSNLLWCSGICTMLENIRFPSMFLPIDFLR